MSAGRVVLVTPGRRTRLHGAISWFLLIVPFHREIIDRDLVLCVEACLPHAPQDRNGRRIKGKRSARQCACGRQSNLTFCVKPGVLQFGEPKGVIIGELPISCPEVLSTTSNSCEASVRVFWWGLSQTVTSCHVSHVTLRLQSDVRTGLTLV